MECGIHQRKGDDEARSFNEDATSLLTVEHRLHSSHSHKHIRQRNRQPLEPEQQAVLDEQSRTLIARNVANTKASLAARRPSSWPPAHDGTYAVAYAAHKRG